MAVWFEGESVIACDIEQVKEAFSNPGEHYVGVVARMPGLSEVTLVDAGEGYVTIRTNEGLMTRSNLSLAIDGGGVIVEFDEVYEAGTSVTATSHFRDEFTAADGGVRHHLVISGVGAPGFLGFLYRSFGSKSIGKAVLESNKGYFEDLST